MLRPEKTKRFGEPLRPESAFSVEVSMISVKTVDGLALVLLARKSAATPATCGLAIEVPLIVLVSLSLPIQAEVISEPGAKTSTQEP